MPLTAMHLSERDHWLRHHARNFLLIALSLVFLPMSLIVTSFAYLLSSAYLIAPQIKPVPPHEIPKRVLVTGVGMTKGLFLCRTFYLGGCEVVGVEFRKNNIPCGKLSRSIERFYSITNPTKSVARYEAELTAIVRRERIDLCVTCSGVATALEDARVMTRVAKKTGCKVFQLSEEAVEILDDKLKFMQFTAEIGLQNPRWHSLNSTEDVPRLLQELRLEEKSGTAPQYIIKSVDMDDASRGAMPIFDFTRSHPDDSAKILKSLVRVRGKRWILQEYFPGEEEYCTHAVIVNGRVQAFLACPSASILMHYTLLDPKSQPYQDMLNFTTRYAAELHERYGPCNGHLSFDFLVRREINGAQETVTLVPIECNPRCHTATILMRGQEKDLSKAYLSQLNDDHPESTILQVDSKRAGKYYWVAHDLVALLIAPLLRKGSKARQSKELQRFIDHLLYWKDPVFEWWDPLPWLILYHVYWPLELLNASLRGVKWKALNVSTTKMFTYT